VGCRLGACGGAGGEDTAACLNPRPGALPDQYATTSPVTTAVAVTRTIAMAVSFQRFQPPMCLPPVSCRSRVCGVAQRDVDHHPTLRANRQAAHANDDVGVYHRPWRGL